MGSFVLVRGKDKASTCLLPESELQVILGYVTLWQLVLFVKITGRAAVTGCVMKGTVPLTTKEYLSETH